MVNLPENEIPDDEISFEKIFKKHYVELCIYAKEFLKDKETAEEIVENTFVKIWENRKEIVIQTSLRAYLYKGVYHNCLNFLRHLKIEEKNHKNLENELTDLQQFTAYSSDYPVANLILKDINEKINQVVESFPPQCKEIFCLSRYEELSYQQICEKLNISVNTVKTQMSRALDKLHIALDEYLAIAILLFFLLSLFF